MNNYKLVVVHRDERGLFYCNILCDDRVLNNSILYSEAMKRIYEIMQKGDTFQEFYLSSGSSKLLSFEEVRDSIGFKNFQNKR